MSDLLAIWTPGPMEMVVILVVAVLLFGKRLPEIARGMGKSVTEFKKGLHETTKQMHTDVQIKDDIDDDIIADNDKERTDFTGKSKTDFTK